MVRWVFVFLLVLTGCVQPKPKEEAHPTENVNAPRVVSPCVISGCNSEICADAEGSRGTVMSTCIVLPQHKCLAFAKCEPQADGHCGWTHSPKSKACLRNLF